MMHYYLLFLLLSSLFSNLVVANPPKATTTAIKKEQILLEGKKVEVYAIEFDKTNYPNEQEIVYQYHVKYYELAGAALPKKEAIGIQLYDIDGDGEKEILAYIEGPGYCGYYCSDYGCDFSIFKKNKAKGHYEVVLNHTITPPIRILSSKKLGVHDFLLGRDLDSEYALWQWNGKIYELTRHIPIEKKKR